MKLGEEHWLEGLVAALSAGAVGVVGLFTKRLINTRDARRLAHEQRHQKVEERVQQLEADRVTKADFDQLTESMTVSLNAHTNAVRQACSEMKSDVLGAVADARTEMRGVAADLKADVRAVEGVLMRARAKEGAES